MEKFDKDIILYEILPKLEIFEKHNDITRISLNYKQYKMSITKTVNFLIRIYEEKDKIKCIFQFRLVKIGNEYIFPGKGD